MDWLDELNKCPEEVSMCENNDNWNDITAANSLHPGGVFEVRSKMTPGGHSNQCVYDKNGKLMRSIPAGGTADYKACTGLCLEHTVHDVIPFIYSQKLDRVSDYYDVRPIY